MPEIDLSPETIYPHEWLVVHSSYLVSIIIAIGVALAVIDVGLVIYTSVLDTDIDSGVNESWQNVPISATAGCWTPTPFIILFVFGVGIYYIIKLW